MLILIVEVFAQGYFLDHTQNLKFRNVGPTRGGRVTTVDGHADHPATFYMGGTGAGVWKTTNYGQKWENISDGYFATGSIGSIAVADSEPKVIFVGTGSDGIRSNVIIGKGLYKSSDSGTTWNHLGLEECGQIGSVLIHPQDTNTVLVAAIGNPFKKNSERGVYLTKDGGKTWSKTLFHSDSVGAVDLEFAPDNPDVVYACLWRAERKPWTIISGGSEGGIYKSMDGGMHWQKLSGGLPTNIIGKSDLAVSPADPDRLWALVEAPEGEGGVYRSDNRGQTFSLISTKKELLDRPFYYCNIDVNPQNANSLYVSATGFWHSSDGGVNWSRKQTPHGDNHEVWINPLDTNLMIQCNDGGANVTRDGGATWSSIENQPTAELYQVAVDDQTPYWLYAGQQDNSTISLPSLPPLHSHPAGVNAYWMAVGGCETGPAVPKPGNPNIVYSNCKGRFGVYNKETGQEMQYYVGASNMYGHNPRDLKFRFQRVSPIHISPHNPDVVYHASQYLHKTTDDGKTWEIISPDLTAFTPETQVFSGSPITRDITGEEFYSTIYVVEESPLEPGIIWTGANDGPIYLTRDDGATWKEVTPPTLPTQGRVQSICASPHDPAKAYVSVYRYLLGDFRPYIFKTEDYGEHWDLLTSGTNGIPDNYPTRVVCEDSEKPGLIYAGTEFGLFVSLNDGKNWQSFQLNLPITPITDLVLHDGDLVLSTMGRGFWILDDRQVLNQLDESNDRTALYRPKSTTKYRYRAHNNVPQYPSPGVNIRYYLAENDEELRLKIYDKLGNLVRSYQSSTPEEPEEEKTDMQTGFWSSGTEARLGARKGAHQLRWDFRHNTLHASEDKRGTRGPQVSPGMYRIDLISGFTTYSTHVKIKMDPRQISNGLSVSDLQDQEKMSLAIQKLLIDVKNLRSQMENKVKESDDESEMKIWQSLLNEIKTAEGRYQTPMLEDQINYLYRMMDQADQVPGKDVVDRFEELKSTFESIRKKVTRPGILK